MSSEISEQYVKCYCCELVTVPSGRCVPSPRLASGGSSGALTQPSLYSRLKSMTLFAFELVAGDLFPFLFQCDACQSYFCRDCAAEILGELRFCPSCTGKSNAMAIVLEDPELRKDGNIWRHVGEMLNRNETIDFMLEKAVDSEFTVVDVDSDESRVELKETTLNMRGSVRTLSKIDCLAKALELQPTRRYWGTLAAAMDWSDHVTIHVAPPPTSHSLVQTSYSLSCLDVFTIALHMEPFNATIWCNLALAMPAEAEVTIGTRPCSKLGCFKMSTELDPKNETAALSYALAMWNETNRSRSSSVSSAEHNTTTNTMQSEVGMSDDRRRVSRRDDLPPVLDLLQTALALDNTSPDAWSAVGTILASSSGLMIPPSPKDIDTVQKLIDVDCTGGVDHITALRMAATLSLSEDAIFQLGMSLTSQSKLRSKNRVCKSQVPDASNTFALTRQAVFESLAELHEIDPKRYPLSSGRKTFAITSTCPNAPSVLKMNARCLITHTLDKNFQPGVQSHVPIVRHSMSEQGTEAWEANSTVEVNLCAPLSIRHNNRTLGGTDEYMYSLRVKVPCKMETPGDYRASQVPKLPVVIGAGKQGCVLKAIMKDPGSDVVSFMAVKVFLYIPQIRLEDDGTHQSGKGSDSMQDVDFEELIESNGDLKFLLSDSLSHVVTAGRYAVVVDLSDPSALATRKDPTDRLSPFPPGRFASLSAPIHTQAVPLYDKSMTNVTPRPFLVLVFMDRALFDLGARCGNINYTPLPKELVPKVMRLASFQLDGSVMEKIAGAPTFQSPLRFILEGEARYYMREVTRHLSRLHGSGCVHNDIKPDNVLILPNGDVRLADFGVSRRSASSLSKRLRDMNCDEDNGKGTFIAPQEPHPKFGADDIWALGQTLRYLLTSKLPGEDDNIDRRNDKGLEMMNREEEQMTRNNSAVVSAASSTRADSETFLNDRSGHYYSVRNDLIDVTKEARRSLAKTRSVKVEPELSAECVSFLEMCLCQKSADRATASSLLAHPFLTDA
ncbi:3-phosphoinositide-dependent protein kinase, putative [Bodo saltans]|uniref:3-phosphoinositide-dependent protein kinase, putative n=1 Tax=Bodo saltans TaxID=75058 RepID=A0A0S4JGK7_BODSA|nr:3-phosphoinositide-dependent protein kinase, putative [Bodo saltans]|eukprot:CUG90620.1 3-phosphoinositide-dependent protein kinase, putative [Bodo saltans]